LVKRVEKVLAQMEGDPKFLGLADRIEAAFARQEFQGSEEQKLLRFAIDSVLHDPTIVHEPLAENEQALGDYEPSGGENPAWIADREERKAILTSALERELSSLSELERQTLIGVYWGEKSQAEIARERGQPTSTINDAHKRAIAKLAQRLGSYRGLYTPSR
jgi:RNA polymerase sigma factor (sigma-70 family)